VAGKLLGRVIRVRHLIQSREARSCQILFISKGEDERLSAIFADLGNAPVVTVGEADDFIDHNGMIRFCIAANKVRFEINLRAADRAGVKFSSRLLLLAKNVFGKPA
jgi:hypothetical protein